MPENVEKTLMRKNNKNKLFFYSGNKEWLVNYINYKLNNNSKQFESYYELFLGSGSIFLNLNRNFDNYILNDKDSYINNFINWITELNDNNLILYTDFENSVSDNLVNFGFKKIKLRTMISTSPNRKSGVEETGNEILYLK